MSSIIAKPFSWANKIVQAVFKGAPNLITTSDLNRQIEALKKEMYVLQQSSSAIVSDLEATLDGNTITVKMSYVFCLGVRFNFEMPESGITFIFNVTNNVPTKELRLYAKKSLVTYEDDFSKEISGAKFDDGTTQPAANHYVYGEPSIAFVTPDTPNEDFQYGDSNGGEYICTLFRIERRADAHYSSNYYIQKFTVPMGKGIVDLSEKYGKFEYLRLAQKSELYQDLVPGANDDWKTATHKLWRRLYTLEKRLFMETLYGKDDVVSKIEINGVIQTMERRFSDSATSPSFGVIEIGYNFHIVGNICFAAGYLRVEKNTMDDPLTRVFAFPIGTSQYELPHALYYTDSACVLQVKDASDNVNNSVYGYLDKNRIMFGGIPASGAMVQWYVAYCFSSDGFWQYSKEDRYGFFDDMR